MEPCICKVAFPIRYTEISETGFVKHLGISNGPFPAALGMEKSHGEVTNSQGIGCDGAIVITQGILIGGRKYVEMGSINGSKSIFKEWE